MLFLWVIIIEISDSLEDYLVIAPSLKISDFLWCFWLVIDHYIRVITKIPKRIDSIKILFHRAVEVGQAVHGLSARVFHSELLREHSKLVFEIVFWIVPCEMQPLDFHLVEVFYISFSCQPDVDALGEINPCTSFSVLPE